MPDSKRYLRPEVTTRIRRLELKARRVVEGFLSGMHRSPYFGQSIEFLQHRQYTRGDEIRHIDWKVYARQDRLHIKQYEEETNLRLTLLVDRSASMAYGDGDLNKFDYSASIAACLSYLALRQKDATGLYTFDTELRGTVPAKSNQQQLTRILSMLDSVGADGRTDLTRVAKQVAQGIPRRGLVLVVSDLLGVDNLLRACVCCDNVVTMSSFSTYFTTTKWISNSMVPHVLKDLKTTTSSTATPARSARVTSRHCKNS